MTLFEYLAVSFSIVLSFAVVRILGGLSDVFARSRVYRVHAAWVIHKLLFLAYVWWNIWSYREVSWNFVSFLAVLASPSLLYYQASALVPAQPGSVASWRDHFYAVRRQFFGAEIAWSLLILLNTTFIVSVPIFHLARITQAIGFVIVLVAIATDRHTVHRVLAWLVLLLWPLRTLLLFQPGALAPH
jgi:hypothetical protein